MRVHVAVMLWEVSKVQVTSVVIVSLREEIHEAEFYHQVG